MALTQNSDLTYSATIDGHEYRFAQYPADKGFRRLAELSQCVGEGLHVKDMASATTDDAQRMALLATAVRALLMGIGSDVERSLRLVKALCCDGVWCDGEPLNEKVFMTHFQGKMPLLFQVVRASLEAQYAPFFAWLQDLLPKRQAPAASTNLSNMGS